MRLVLLVVFAMAGVAGAQSPDVDGLDLSTPKEKTKIDVPAPPLPPPPADFTEGPPVAALPPVRPSGRIELDTYRVLHAALQERLGARLVSAELAQKAVESEKLGQKLATIAARERLSELLKAQLLVVLDAPAGKVEAHLLPGPLAPSVADASVALGRGKKLTQALARSLVDELLKKGESSLRPATPTVDLTGPVEAPVAGPEETESIAGEALGRRPERAKEPLTAPRVFLVVGAGPGFRTFNAVSESPVVPETPAVMTALGVAAAVFPLRFVPSLATGPLSDLWVEGFYRRNLVQATVASGGTSRTCAVVDDELLGRIGYRYSLGTSLPRIGVGAGIAWERTNFACGVTTLDTGYGSSEFHLKVLQPILGEALTVELSGGPRLLFSTRAAGRDTRAFSGELWVTGRPMSYLTMRVGARVTGTKLTTWPDGVPLFDVRTFVGLEVGAAL